MAQREDTDYNPAIRREVKDDATTGRTVKKWKHRTQGALVGAAGTAAAIAGRKPLAAIARRLVKKKATSMSRTDLSIGGFQGMLDASLRLQKRHALAWKGMSRKEREKAKADLRMHRKALDDQESHSWNSPTASPSGMLSALEEKMTELIGKEATTDLADANGKPHNQAGEFEPAADGLNPAAIQRAYSPHKRLTGISPLGKSIRKRIAKRALERVGQTTDL